MYQHNAHKHQTRYLLIAALVALLALLSGFVIGKAAATSLYNHTATGGAV